MLVIKSLVASPTWYPQSKFESASHVTILGTKGASSEARGGSVGVNLMPTAPGAWPSASMVAIEPQNRRLNAEDMIAVAVNAIYFLLYIFFLFFSLIFFYPEGRGYVHLGRHAREY